MFVCSVKKSFVVFRTLGNIFSRVLVNSVICDITFSRMFRQSQHLILYTVPCLSLGSSLSLTFIISCCKVVFYNVEEKVVVIHRGR